MANEERINKIIDELTLFDDDLMSRVFDKNIEATEYVLQIILGRKITVVSVKGQENFKNPVTNGRNITLDVQGMPLHVCAPALLKELSRVRLCAPRRGSLDSFVKSATPHAALSFCCSSANFLSSATVLELDINV